MKCCLGGLILLFLSTGNVDAHARLCRPASRSYMWRDGYDTPINYNDNQLNCGGFGEQWYKNKGRCGTCGDRWDNKIPRQNEAGGLYGQGIVVEEYKQGGIMQAVVQVTANHKGYFEFRICPTNDPKKRATEKCLDLYLLKLTNGKTRFHLPSRNGNYTLKLQLPKYLQCKHCVFQWKYHTGNSFGCNSKDPKSCCVGCGPMQEEFYSCADIAITKTGNTGMKIKPSIKSTTTQAGSLFKTTISNQIYSEETTTRSVVPTEKTTVPQVPTRRTVSPEMTTTIRHRFPPTIPHRIPPEMTTTIKHRVPPEVKTTESNAGWHVNSLPKTYDECFDMCFKFCTRGGQCPVYCYDCLIFPKY